MVLFSGAQRVLELQPLLTGMAIAVIDGKRLCQQNISKSDVELQREDALETEVL